jgi:hypothetical protein
VTPGCLEAIRCRSWPSGKASDVESSREERVARNEELFLVVNREIEKLEETLGRSELLTLLCECSKKHCLSTLKVEPAAYQRVRSNPLLFFLALGHEDREVERVVEQTPEYLVVEKLGRTAEAVRERNW